MVSEVELLQVMRRHYPGFVSKYWSPRLRPSMVPGRLVHFIPMAELWGEPDDGLREQLSQEAPPEAREHLRQVIGDINEWLDEWLAGPEVNDAPYSPEYVAFSAMRMASDMM